VSLALHIAHITHTLWPRCERLCRSGWHGSRLRRPSTPAYEDKENVLKCGQDVILNKLLNGKIMQTSNRVAGKGVCRCAYPETFCRNLIINTAPRSNIKASASAHKETSNISRIAGKLQATDTRAPAVLASSDLVRGNQSTHMTTGMAPSREYL
jgi:hypothetical protein